jgi:predicted nucleotidyltransferase
MTPSSLRAVLEPFLAGTMSLAQMVEGLRALGESPSSKVQGLVASLLYEADLLLTPERNTSRWPTSPAVVSGLAGELLDTLPEADSPPTLDAVMSILAKLGPEFSRDFGIDILGLGGSTAKGTNTAFSDLDVAAQCNRDVRLKDIAGAMLRARDELAWPVELVFLDRAEQPFRDRFASSILPIAKVVA